MRFYATNLLKHADLTFIEGQMVIKLEPGQSAFLSSTDLVKTLQERGALKLVPYLDEEDENPFNMITMRAKAKFIEKAAKVAEVAEELASKEAAKDPTEEYVPAAPKRLIQEAKSYRTTSIEPLYIKGSWL